MGLFGNLYRQVKEVYGSKPSPPAAAAKATATPAKRGPSLELRKKVARQIVDAEDGSESFWVVGERIAGLHGLSIFDVTDEYNLLKDEVEQATEAKVLKANSSTVEESKMTVGDLRNLECVRTRIKGSAYYVTDSERAVFGGTEYLLVREPDNQYDANAIGIYGKGRKVGHVSAAKAGSMAELLDLAGADAYKVAGTSVSETSMTLWIDLPKLPALRIYVKSRS
ncbi:HIRAN domain-containing protein [Subtercola sp. PAMC28395]|uniref:HIRAN domain-containing protein n=1 Tax=Subtercola sp. PAMC28395 TaxID=2846775 RepID=UPI001C0B9C87|nr:HIRAN domain-containing protein [Subtercola sp. PAMC28395]QWT25160.1 HIRAN domain-containing protein [Subtercola sp. PAMC28395]